MMQSPELYTAVGTSLATFVIVVSQWITSHLKGRARDHKHGEQLETLTESVNGLTLEVRDVKALVVGPDGQNGLRGDLRDIKKRVIGLEDRERDGLSPRDVGNYDRRGT